MIEAIRKILADTTAITTVVPAGRLFLNKRDQATTLPAILIEKESNTPNETKDHSSGIDEWRITVTCFAADYIKASYLSRQVRLAIDNYSGTVEISVGDQDMDDYPIYIERISYTDEADIWEDQNDGLQAITQVYTCYEHRQGAYAGAPPVIPTPGEGPPGASAYEVAVENGFEGTEVEWLASLEGPQGPQGPAGGTGATGPQGPAGSNGVNADMTRTSSDNVTIGTGSKSFNFDTPSSNLGWLVGTRLRAAVDVDNWVEGEVTAVDAASVTIDADLTNGSGTFATWNITITGARGSQGATGSSGSNGTNGANAYVYIAYADDASGTGFTNTFNSSKDYIAIKATTTAIASPVASDFTGLWKNYKGATGATGATGPSGSTAVVLASDVANSTTSMADIVPTPSGQGLVIPVVSGGIYKFRAVLDYTSAALTTGSRFGLSGSFTRLTFRESVTVNSGTPEQTFAGLNATNQPASPSGTSVSTTNNLAVVEGIFTASATGNVTIQVASEVATSAITVKAGSYVEYSRLV